MATVEVWEADRQEGVYGDVIRRPRFFRSSTDLGKLATEIAREVAGSLGLESGVERLVEVYAARGYAFANTVEIETLIANSPIEDRRRVTLTVHGSPLEGHGQYVEQIAGLSVDADKGLRLNVQPGCPNLVADRIRERAVVLTAGRPWHWRWRKRARHAIGEFRAEQVKDHEKALRIAIIGAVSGGVLGFFGGVLGGLLGR